MSHNQKRVTARKRHKCMTCDRAQNIQPGDVYYQSTIFPDGEANPSDKPLTFKECAECSNRYGRGHILEPLPEDQAARIYTKALQEGWA